MFVKEAMKTDIKTIGSDVTVLEAARAMRENRIGSLIVVDDALEGIVTERDVLNKVVAEGKEPGKVRVRDIMSRDVITISPDEDMEEASDLMDRKGIKRLPVVFGDEVIGIITSSDVVEILSRAIREIYSQQ